MIIENAEMLVTNTAMKEMQDHTIYCAVGLLSLDDGQKFDVSIRDKDIYLQIKPMIKVIVNLDLTNSKYGLKLSVRELLDVGKSI